ncbi:MAG: tetratricopeptide repeat protein [Rhodospirillales bacterium]|nr:tetratricopeptide repeat protein [Rhodospirillales bacterium]
MNHLFEDNRAANRRKPQFDAATEGDKLASMDDMIGAAMRFHQSGALADAERAYRKVLKRAPERADILHLLGLVAHQSGRNREAAKIIRRAIKRAPQEISYRVNYAIVLNALSRWQEAEKSCRAVLKVQPNHSEALNNLGRALLGQNQIEAAAGAYRRALESDPANAAVHNNLGLLFMQMGRTGEAVASFQAALSQNPDFTLALANLGSAYMQLGRLSEAEDACRRAISLDANFAPALHSLGVIKSTGGKFEEAAELFDRVLSTDPNHLHARINLASVLLIRGSHDAAEKLFMSALELDPGSAEAHLNLGMCLVERGFVERADHCFRQAIASDPKNLEAYYNLAVSGRGGFDDLDQANIKELEENPGLSTEQKVKIQFVLAALACDAGDAGQEFEYCRAGNALRKTALAAGGVKFDADSHQRLVADIAETFNDPFFKARPNFGIRGKSPIFVVGVPRSGTTLVEQIIGAHSRVTSLGERDDIAVLIKEAAGLVNGKSEYPGIFNHLTEAQVRQMAEAHSVLIEPLAGGGTYATDKTPFNFLNLGVIALMFPDCRIIHCTRDVRDTAL